MDTQNVGHPHNRVSLSLQKDGYPVTCYAVMHPEDVMLREISHEKTNAVWVHLDVSRAVQLLETELEWGLPRAGGRGNGGCIMGMEFQFF